MEQNARRARWTFSVITKTFPLDVGHNENSKVRDGNFFLRGTERAAMFSCFGALSY